MKNKLFAYFDINPYIEYPIVNGATYEKNFTEQIDSMHIVLDGIESENRLKFNKPYHFVKIVNKGENGFKWNNNDYIFMLVDNWTETLVDIYNKIYRYEINLMNCVKLLEKVQCPNLVITHSLVNGTKTIYEYIDQYMTLYCPKVKITDDGENWYYAYLLEWKHLENDSRLQAVCADMQMNEPTLRELLTNLMLQVSCIPTLNYRTLDMIDFKEEPEPFNIEEDSGITEAIITGASDSYVNSLIVSPTQTLESDNPVIAESIGFRDSENVLIKKRENLKLETRFPIYKINRVLLSRVTNSNSDGLWPVPLNERNNATENFYPILQSNPQGGEYTISTWWTAPRIFKRSNGNYYVRLLFRYNASLVHKCYLRNIKVHLCHSYSSGLEEIKEVSFSGGPYFIDFNDNSSNERVNIGAVSTSQELIVDSNELGPTEAPPVSSSDERDYFMDHSWCFYARINIITNADGNQTQKDALFNSIDYIWFENYCDNVVYRNNHFEVSKTYHQIVTPGELTNNYLTEENHQNDIDDSLVNRGTYVKYIDTRLLTGANNDNVSSGNVNEIRQQSYEYWYPNLSIKKISLATGNSCVDITSLIVEARKRSLLDTNFKDMSNVNTLSDLSKYIYGTVSYSIGSNKITGFSDTYTQTKGWWDENYSYFENILSFIKNHPEYVSDFSEYDDTVKDKLEQIAEQFGNIPVETFSAPNTFSSIVETGVFGQSNLLDANYYVNEYIFNIEYYPLNSLKVELSKKSDDDVRIKLQQLNQTSDGLTDFSRFINNSQDIVNRIGNNVMIIKQTTDNISYVNDVNTIYDNHTIFNKVVEINEDYLQIKYTASEDYVIKNYFTSIVTKYRAYEYVDYNQSVIRKEVATIYCLLSKDNYFDGDDLIKWGGTYTNTRDDLYNPSLLLTGVQNNDKILAPRYELETSLNEEDDKETIRNEVSVLTADTILIFNYQNYDNVSAGVQISIKEWNAAGIVLNTPMYLEGIIQKWQVWNQTRYNRAHEVFYTTSVEYTGDVIDYVSSLCKFPVLDDNWNFSDYIIFQYVDYNKSALIMQSGKLYFKDNSEIINQTVEFNFYTNSDDILINENFVRYSKLSKKSNYIKRYITTGDKYELFKYSYSLSSKNRELITSQDVVELGYDGFDYILVKWSLLNVDSFIITLYKEENGIQYSEGDIIAFKRDSSLEREDIKYYLTLNDTKTVNVYHAIQSGDNSELFETYECSNGALRKCHLKTN